MREDRGVVWCTGHNLTVCVGVSSASVSAVSVVNEMLPVTGSAQCECEPVCRMNHAGENEDSTRRGDINSERISCLGYVLGRHTFGAFIV